MQVLGARKRLEPGVADRTLHRIDRIALAGEHRELDELVHRLVQGLRTESGKRHRAVADTSRRHAHPVGRERARLVHAQHRGGAEHLECGHTPGQHAALPDPPGAQAEEDRQHDGQLLGQQRHGRRHTHEQAVEPVVAGRCVHHGHQQTERRARDRDATDHASGLALHPGGLGNALLERLADAPQLGPHAGGEHPRKTLALHDHRAREQPRPVVAARRPHAGAGFVCNRCLAHRHRFSRQKGLVDRDVHAGQQHGVGRHPVAFGQLDQVAGHHIAAGHAYASPVPDHERARARQVTQRIERPLGATLLHQGDAHHEHHEAQQHRGFARITEQQVEGAACDQQQEHRFGRHPRRDLHDRTRPSCRQFVGTRGSAPLCSIGC